MLEKLKRQHAVALANFTFLFFLHTKYYKSLYKEIRVSFACRWELSLLFLSRLKPRDFFIFTFTPFVSLNILYITNVWWRCMGATEKREWLLTADHRLNSVFLSYNNAQTFTMLTFILTFFIQFRLTSEWNKISHEIIFNSIANLIVPSKWILNLLI